MLAESYRIYTSDAFWNVIATGLVNKGLTAAKMHDYPAVAVAFPDVCVIIEHSLWNNEWVFTVHEDTDHYRSWGCVREAGRPNYASGDPERAAESRINGFADAINTVLRKWRKIH